MTAVKKISDNFRNRKKYNRLKAYDFENMTTDQMVYFRGLHKISVADAQEFIKTYEENNKPDPETQKKVTEYFNKLFNPKPKEKKYIDKEWLYNRFKKAFYENEGKHFLETEETIENIKPLIFYFIGDFENFKKCKNVSNITEPSIKKGLALIGPYGNGKSSAMRALESALRRTSAHFKSHTTKQTVRMFENAKKGGDTNEFYRLMLNGTIYFDDSLTEKEASKFGKHDLFEEIFEERYERKKRTYISINPSKDCKSLEEAFDQLGERYGGRMDDRSFSMFNIIEFKGKSFRK